MLTIVPSLIPLISPLERIKAAESEVDDAGDPLPVPYSAGRARATPRRESRRGARPPAQCRATRPKPYTLAVCGRSGGSVRWGAPQTRERSEVVNVSVQPTHPSPDPAAGAAVKAADRAHVFHSWSAQELIDPLAVAGAEGSYFWDYDGNRYLDFTCQLVNTNIGHQHPKVVAAIQEQAAKLCTFAPGFAVDVALRGGAADRRAHPRRPRQDLLHQRRRRGRRERGPHGPAAHRPRQGALRLPLVPRRPPPPRST